MEPGLPSGSIVLFRRGKAVKAGDVVLVEHPKFGKIVKEVSAVSHTGAVHLRGTSRHSTSEEKLGSVAGDAILGIMLSRVL